MSLSRETLLELAETHGTPLYVYDGDLAVRRYEELFEFISWRPLRIHYAMKANYNPILLRLLKDAGASIDAVSPAEVELALAVGFPKENIIYTANNITDAEVAEVMETGVMFNIGSLSRLEKFAAAYPGTSICLRFNPDVVDGAHKHIMTGGDLTKFGILMKDADKAADIARNANLKVVGLHEHTGSGLQHTESVFKSMENLISLATPERFPNIRFLDFGGGFKVPYEPDEPRIDYPAMGADIARRFEKFAEQYGKTNLEMRFEPGKYIVAEAGYLISRVNTIKNNNGRLIAGCDSGFPQLIRPILYEAYHNIVNLSNPNATKKKYDVCGNICESGDRFAEQREISEIREGDLLAIENAGAYCHSMGSVYNLRPMPPEVVVANGKTTLTKPRVSNKAIAEAVIGNR
jgi:diaminopimelate decarboxylase